MNKLLAAHNETASDSNGQYTIILTPVGKMQSLPYIGLAAGIICVLNDAKKCRNRNFWVHTIKIKSHIVAGIAFANMVAANPSLRPCRASS
jgi:hypothetical protein